MQQAEDWIEVLHYWSDCGLGDWMVDVYKNTLCAKERLRKAITSACKVKRMSIRRGGRAELQSEGTDGEVDDSEISSKRKQVH